MGDSTQPGGRGAEDKLFRVTFTIHGQVQGVNFRQEAVKAANDIKCKGFVKNSAKGTVVGELQGTQAAVSYMQGWLEQQGSAESKIEKAEFSEMEEIQQLGFDTFAVDGEDTFGTPAKTEHST